MVGGLCDIDKEQLATRVVIVRQGDREMELELCEYHYNQLKRQQYQPSPLGDEQPTGWYSDSSEENFASFASQLGYSPHPPGREVAGIEDIVSDQSKEFIQQAAETAVKFGRREVDTEHLLYALTGSKTVQHILKQFKVKSEDIRTSIDDEALKTDRPARPDEPIELTVPHRMKEVLDIALKTTDELGDALISPEHLLVGLAQEDEGTGGEILRKYGLTPRAIRKKIAHGAKG